MTTPQLAENVRGKGRHYCHPHTGELVPSVTNCISVLDKPALPRWAAKSVAASAWEMRHSLAEMEEAEAIDILKGSPWRKSQRAADRGTSIHEWMQAWMDDTPLPELTGEAALYESAARKWIADHNPHPVATEVTVFGDGYAGTFDLLADVDRHKSPHGGRGLFIVDYKTGKALYPEVQLQLSALAHGYTMILPDGTVQDMPEVDGVAAVLFTPGGYTHEEYMDRYDEFRACLTLWHWMKGDG